MTCASRRVGQAAKPPLNPISVSGPFNLVGVDVIKFPKSQKGNQYTVVFMDYLTKWPEVFPTRDQSSHQKSQKGNQYAVVFMDYLTKWPEVFPTRD